jgi:hypothetical protein
MLGRGRERRSSRVLKRRERIEFRRCREGTNHKAFPFPFSPLF